MAREVLLMTDVPGLGSEGDVVSVNNGYARNYLFPRNLAAPVTAATRRRLEKIRRDREIKRQAELDEARKRAADLENISCTIAVKTSDGEALYGSVTAVDVAESLKTMGIEIDRHCIVLEKPIKELGVFDVAVRLHADVGTSVKVWVVEE